MKTKLNDTMYRHLLHEGRQRPTAKQRATSDTHHYVATQWSAAVGPLSVTAGLPSLDPVPSPLPSTVTTVLLQGMSFNTILNELLYSAATKSSGIIIIIIIIIIIAFEGAIEDFLQSPHCVANRLQHVHSRGPGAIVCKSCAKHPALIMCNMCYVPHGTKGQLSF